MDYIDPSVIDTPKVGNKPRDIALRYIDEYLQILPEGPQVSPADLTAYNAFYDRLEKQPEPVRWLFAFELQHIISNIAQYFRQQVAAAEVEAKVFLDMQDPHGIIHDRDEFIARDKKAKKALLNSIAPEDLTIMKSSLNFIKKTLGPDTSYRASYLRDTFNGLSDNSPANPIEVVKIICDDKCPDYIRSSNVSDPVSKPPRM